VEKWISGGAMRSIALLLYYSLVCRLVAQVGWEAPCALEHWKLEDWISGGGMESREVDRNHRIVRCFGRKMENRSVDRIGPSIAPLTNFQCSRARCALS